MCRHYAWLLLVLISLLLLAGFVPACAQISPGPLSKAHESLAGPLKCTSCHTFGAGSPQLKCLSCHRDIRERIARGTGYHARVVNPAKLDADCARCHPEHYGEDFNIVKWPTTRSEFDHRQAGYPLTGRHANLSCERCHNPRHLSADERSTISSRDTNRTFLGLSQGCVTCHNDVHNGQLGVDCQRCHGFEHWKSANGFNHATTKFPLTGKHETVACAKCHPSRGSNATVQFKLADFEACATCHKDPHHGAFHGPCQSCHDTTGWKTVRLSAAFDHSRTKFPLEGKHNGLRCAQCHKTTNFSEPVTHALCLDCHRDQHQGQFAARAGGGDCAGCHRDTGWQPATYTVASHAGSRFPLLGKHAQAPCSKCHAPAGAGTDYHPRFAQCVSCHRDIHVGQFAARGKGCEDCHTVEAFKPSTFTMVRHQASTFPLKEAHAAVACTECHKADPSLANHAARYQFQSHACTTCHRDPHQGAFHKVVTKPPGREVCGDCHTLRSWQDQKPFAHDVTGYPLEGAHRTLACTDCHHRNGASSNAVTIAFHDTPKNCAQCHADVHAGQFKQTPGGQTACERCHTQVRWAAALFDHEKGTSFSLAGAHARVPCKGCHVQRQEVDGHRVVLYRGTPRGCSDCHRSL